MMISVFDRIENIVAKGENACYQHFHLFPQCFQKASFPDMSKSVIVWEWVKGLDNLCFLQIFGTVTSNDWLQPQAGTGDSSSMNVSNRLAIETIS